MFILLKKRACVRTENVKPTNTTKNYRLN